MSSRPSTSGLTFRFPYIGLTLNLPLSEDLRTSMREVTDQVRTFHKKDYDELRETIIKILPIAVGILAAVVLSPLWLPVAGLSSLLLGPLSWIVAGVAGCYVWEVSQKVTKAFEEQCPEIVNYGIARGVMHKKNISLENLSQRSW